MFVGEVRPKTSIKFILPRLLFYLNFDHSLDLEVAREVGHDDAETALVAERDDAVHGANGIFGQPNL